MAELSWTELMNHLVIAGKEIRAEERESCAKIAESFFGDIYTGGTEREAGRAIAAAIRNTNWRPVKCGDGSK